MGDPLVQNDAQFVAEGAPREFKLQLQGERKHAPVKISRVDSEHGSILRAYRGMGSPEYPTVSQLEQLKQAGQLPEPETAHLSAQGEIAVAIPPNGVALLELG
jgi:xylan 1,4-beta-xylosidase